MKFNIHFTIGEYEDYFTVESDTIEGIKELASIETSKRGLTEADNNLWSEETI